MKRFQGNLVPRASHLDPGNEVDSTAVRDGKRRFYINFSHSFISVTKRRATSRFFSKFAKIYSSQIKRWRSPENLTLHSRVTFLWSLKSNPPYISNRFAYFIVLSSSFASCHRLWGVSKKKENTLQCICKMDTWWTTSSVTLPWQIG